MIAAALLLLQLVGARAIAAPHQTVTIRAPYSSAEVPIVWRAGNALVELDRVAEALPVGVRPRGNGHFDVALAGIAVELVDQLPFARVGRRVYPLGSVTRARGGRLEVPLRLITELLPRLASKTIRYDVRRGELAFGSPGGALARVANAGALRVAKALAVRPSRGHVRRRVIVDAGHGGPDNGMSGPIGSSKKIYEKDITLAVAKRVSAALKERGVDVVMTRTRDTLIALSDRGRIANDAHGDVFVSIHVNAANLHWKRPGDARGFETYFLAEAKTEDARRVERMENESVRFETGAQAARHDPLNFVIHDMAQNEHLRESSELAQMIQRRLALMHPGENRGVKQAGFRVLVTAYMPAVLVEIGFGTNKAEAKFISDPKSQKTIAAAVADATMEYLSHYERRLGVGR